MYDTIKKESSAPTALFAGCLGNDRFKLIHPNGVGETDYM